MEEWWGGLINWHDWQWGSVAEWVTGLLTAIAVMVAARAYTHEKAAQERAQVLLLKLERRPRERTTDVFHVSNNSTAAFTSVNVYYRPDRERLKDMRRNYDGIARSFFHVAMRNLWRHPSEIRENLLDIRFYLTRYPRYATLPIEALPVGDSYRIEFTHRGIAQRAMIDVVDASGRRWTRWLSSSGFIAQWRMRRVRESGDWRMPQGDPDYKYARLEV